jgi:predicted nucleic-acid-binding Zn-ribbon protein
MDAPTSQCPKCTGQMDRGFVLDRNNMFGLAADRFPRWVEGEPERGSSGGWKTSGKRTNEISRAERCENCGFLEFYTSKEVQYI